MIPKLYQKDGTTLIGNLTNCIECLVEEERNGVFELTLQYPNTEAIASSLLYDNIIVCNAGDILVEQKFRIYDTRRMMSDIIEVYARHISFDLAYDYIDSIDISNQSCEYALNTIFRNSQFSAGFVGHSDIINAQNFKISNCNCLEAIAGKEGSIIDTYGTGAEVLRNNYDIYVYNKRGNDNGVSIEYAKNLTGFELQEDTDDLITRIIPFATYTPEGGTETRVQGSAVDSSYINNYSHPFIAEIDFSDKFEDKEEPTTAKLTTMAQRYFEENKCDLPKQNWKIEFIPLSKCAGFETLEDDISLCDTVTIKDTRYNINTKAKVIKTVYDVLRERYESMELGEPRTTLGDIVNTGSEKGEQGPPGPQGPPGADGNIGNFPDSVPTKPVLTTTLLGFASIQLDWTYENKPYYWYEVYASKVKDFTPNVFDIVHKGQTSSFLFQAKPGETWYFRVCGVNSYDHRSGFSDQKEVITTKVDDLSNYFTTAAIGQAVVGSFTADYMEAGIIKGNWIDAKNLSVTDGNGKRTLDIDSFGNVNLDVSTLQIQSEDVATKSLVTQTANSITTSVSNNYASKSELTQTANSIIAKFDTIDYPNLMPNSNPKQGNYAGWTESDGAIFINNTNGDAAGILLSGQSTEGFAWSPSVSVTNGKWYSVKVGMMAERNTKGGEVYVIGSNSRDYGYDQIIKIGDCNNDGEWRVIQGTFQINNGITSIRIRIDNNGLQDTSSYYDVGVYFSDIMLVSGQDVYPNWTESISGLSSGITKIDKYGVHVTHDDGSSTNLNAKALNFYDTRNSLYAQVQGGMYKFWNGSQYIGYMGHTAWADTNDQERVIVLASEYGCSTSLSSRTSSNSKYQTWVATFGKDTQVNNTTFHKGCTLTSPHLSGVFKLYGTSAMTDTYPAQIYHASDGQLAMFGDNKVAIGVMEGTNLRTGIMITEDGSSSNKNHLDFYGGLNMNGYPITNAQSVNSLNATSAQTYALRTMSDEETYSDPTVKTITDIFPSQTPTEGEIRWTDRETHFTSEVETGVYECYIEIPWWIAQNLEDNYHINITPRNGFYQYYISENDPYYFTVRSDKDSMGFTFEIVGKLLDNNTTAKNASIASDQYGASASEPPDIIPEFDIKEIESPVPEAEV